MDWNKFITPCISIFFGSPRSGKSFCLEWVMYNLWRQGRFHHGMVFCPTAQNNKSYSWMAQSKLLPAPTPLKKKNKDGFTETRYKEIDQIIEYQAKHPGINCFIIFDDVNGLCNWYLPQLINLISTFRHHRISLFVASQQICRATSPLLRECCTYGFCWDQNIRASIKAIHENMITLETEQKVKDWLKKYCKDHAFVFVNRNESDIPNRYIVLKAQAVPKFRLPFK